MKSVHKQALSLPYLYCWPVSVPFAVVLGKKKRAHAGLGYRIQRSLDSWCALSLHYGEIRLSYSEMAIQLALAA